MSKLTPTPVQCILLHCCSFPGEESGSELRALLSGFHHWEQLLNEVEEAHRLTPMVFQHLYRGCRDLVPSSLMDRLAESYRVNAAKTLQLTAILIQVAESLSQAGIRWICYKGPVLAHILYGDLGLRHAIDVDFLVPESRFDGMDEILLSHGLERHTPLNEGSDLLSSLHFFSPERGVQVDVHWRLFRPYYGMKFDFDRLWDRRQKVEVGGSTLITLHPHDRIIVLGSHGAKHLWQHFKWLCDFRLAVDDCGENEWQAILTRCHRLEAESLFHPALWTLHPLLGIQFPRLVQESLDRSPKLARTGRLMAQAALSPSRTGSLSSVLLKLKLIPTPRLRIHYLADGVRRRVLGSRF